MIELINDIKNKNMLCCEEEAATSNSGTIVKAFKINIKDGKGFYESGASNTFWSTLIIKAKIYQPQNGIWSIIIRDKANRNLVVYKNNHVLQDEEISFNYKTGLVVNLLLEAIWNQSKDTVLSGEITIRY